MRVLVAWMPLRLPHRTKFRVFTGKASRGSARSGLSWEARRGKCWSREQGNPGWPSMGIFGTLGTVVRLFLMMGGAGDGGPRKLDRQPWHAACPRGEETQESISNGAREVVTAPLRKCKIVVKHGAVSRPRALPLLQRCSVDTTRLFRLAPLGLASLGV
jgi:hypothetical protein